MTEPGKPSLVTVHKLGYRIEVPVDADGTPIIDGERCVEVEPGEWMHPVGAALYAMFADETAGLRIAHRDRIDRDE